MIATMLAFSVDTIIIRVLTKEIVFICLSLEIILNLLQTVFILLLAKV